MAYVPIITAIELAIVDRLTRGLGTMVAEVKTYGGEFDDDEFENVVRRFPAVWVQFGGVKRTEPINTSHTKWKAEGVFAVMVGARNVRSEAATRHGGPGSKEVGTNLLISSVRHLLNNQDLGLPIVELEPGPIRTLFNTRTKVEAVAVFAMEFRTAWREDALFIGSFPDTSDPMVAVFQQYDGKVDPEPVDINTIMINYFLRPGDGSIDKPDAQDQMPMQPE